MPERTPEVRLLASGLVHTWADPNVDKSYIGKTAGAVAVSAAQPVTLATMITLIRPSGRSRGGIFIKSQFGRTAGTGATWAASLLTKSRIFAVGAASPDLLTCPFTDTTSPRIMTANDGGVWINQGANAPQVCVAAPCLRIAGNSTIVTAAGGNYAEPDRYSGHINFSQTLYSDDWGTLGAVAFFLVWEPNAAGGTGNTFTRTDDIYEVWA